MLENIYNNLVETPSDINEHLPTLKKYTEECNHVTEMGVRWVVSTYAFLMGKPKTLVSIDIQSPADAGIDMVKIEEMARNIGCEFTFKLGNTLEINIEQTDLLFIDTWHAYIQLKNELERYHNKVNKYIILHDTTLFESIDEANHYNSNLKGDKEGLWSAVEEFLQIHKEWELHERYTNNNGLTILKRK